MKDEELETEVLSEFPIYTDNERWFRCRKSDDGTTDVRANLVRETAWVLFWSPREGLRFMKSGGEYPHYIMVSSNPEYWLKLLREQCVNAEAFPSSFNSEADRQLNSEHLVVIDNTLTIIAAYEDRQARKPAEVGKLVYRVLSHRSKQSAEPCIEQYLVRNDRRLIGNEPLSHLQISENGCTVILNTMSRTWPFQLGKEELGQYWTTSLRAAKRWLARVRSQK